VDLPIRGPAKELASAVRVALPIVLGAVMAAWVIGRDAPRGAPAAPPLPPWRPWSALAAHLAAFGATAAFARNHLGADVAAPGAVPVLVLLALAAVTALLAVATIAPPAWLVRCALARWRVPLAALAVGILAWVGAACAEALWSVLSSSTLRGSAWLLGLASQGVQVDAATSGIALRGFAVTVAPECSGADGIGLVVLFQGLWIALGRARFRLPHAFALLPLGALAAVGANVLRIAMLVAVGASGYPGLAVGVFHSKLGWAFFVAIALGSVAIAERHPWLRARSDRAGAAA
jgi:exosortase/archaeosortase family protein